MAVREVPDVDRGFDEVRLVKGLRGCGSSALLDGLGVEDRRKLIAACRRRRFASREVVFHEGDPGDSMHLIQGGRFAVRCSTPMGDVATLRLLGPGAFFGELVLLD